MSSYYPPNLSKSSHNSSSSSPNPLIPSIYSQLSQSIGMKDVPDNPICSEFTTSGIRAVDSAAANMRTLTESEKLSIRVELLESALAEISRVLGDCKTKPSPEFLAGWKDYLATEVMNLLLFERWMSESVDQNEKFNSAENFELVGLVLNKSMLIEKVIDEKLEGASIDLSSTSNFTQNSSKPLVPDASDEDLYSTTTTNFSRRSGESKMNENKVDVNLKSIQLDLSSERNFFQKSSTPGATDEGYKC
ncbi:uncharacterized protein LOC113287296 isoform X2 [Papaver somniferum]|uniref:uncharacterized protein LOC113287296 isoform X2 n=1 Tax=Papaver somniferum TaxID=3469 RepID=UPI000E6FB9F3|nr:uncharacterized protein LOC113287296 isoform X2 [Papaver somniferum]